MSSQTNVRNIPISMPQQQASPVPQRHQVHVQIPQQPQFEQIKQPSPQPPPQQQYQPSQPQQHQPQQQPQFPQQLRKQSTIEDVGNKIVSMLDEIERRVENMRETANVMEMEKESLMEMLNTVMMNKDMLRLGQSDKEDLEATVNRLMTRCRTVQVSVSTPRNPDQEKALRSVNDQIEELLTKIEQNLNISKDACVRYLNACNPELPAGPIDQKFQSAVIGCTAEDQKKIRRRLEHLLTQIDRAEHVFDAPT